jgi:GNAT superfamily N-acetyltransferase
MRIEKLSDTSPHLDKVINMICARHMKIYGIPLCEAQTRYYCIEYTFVMVNKDNDLVGFASVSRVDSTYDNWFLSIISYILSLLLQCVFLYDVYILPKYRKQGNGKTLIHLMTKEITSNYVLVRNIYLHCKPSLVPFYAANDFHVNRVIMFNNERLVLMNRKMQNKK